jgi:hypothetical protein
MSMACASSSSISAADRHGDPVRHRGTDFSSRQVFTAYEYLEQRFDGKTRTLASIIFLLQRGLSRASSSTLRRSCFR